METADHEEPALERPLIKRRWAVVRRAGGGAALLAVAGAIALGSPAEQSDSGDDPADGGAQVSAEA